MIVLYFDSETTGVKSYKNPGFIPKLVQLGVILQDTDSGRVLSEINLISNPKESIPPEASRVHGITDNMARKFGLRASDIDVIFYHLMDTADLVVAHNISYDVDICKDNLPSSYVLLEKKAKFCTMKASQDIVKSPYSDKALAYFRDHPEKKDGEYKKPNLTETYQHFFGIPFEGAHDAMADIRACRDIFFQLLSRDYYSIKNNTIKKVGV